MAIWSFTSAHRSSMGDFKFSLWDSWRPRVFWDVMRKFRAFRIDGSNLIFRFNSAWEVPVLDPEDEGNSILRKLGNTLPNDTAYRSLNSILVQSKKCPLGANTTIELESITTTSHNTGTLPSQNTPRQMPLVSPVAVILFSSVVVLTPNGQFLDFATIAFSGRWKSRFEGMGHDVSSTSEMEAQIALLTVGALRCAYTNITSKNVNLFFNLFLECKFRPRDLCKNFHLTLDLAEKYFLNTSTLCER